MILLRITLFTDYPKEAAPDSESIAREVNAKNKKDEIIVSEKCSSFRSYTNILERFCRFS